MQENDKECKKVQINAQKCEKGHKGRI